MAGAECTHETSLLGFWEVAETWHKKITVLVRVSVLENVLGLKLTLQLLGSHCGVHLGLPFAGGTCCVSILFTALAPFASFPSGLDDFNKSPLYWCLQIMQHHLFFLSRID